MVKMIFCSWRHFLISVFFLGIFTGCYSFEVEDAFKGKFSSIKNNKVINDYCQSCHIHREFDTQKHILAKRKLYKRKLYRKASSCRICHFVEPVWAREELIRKTRYPRAVKLGKYREFEQKERKKRE